MHRTALRQASRPALRGLRIPQSASRRYASSTASPADKSRSWKSSAVRWGLAAGALYYYNTSSVFAEEVAPQTVAPPPAFPESDLPTVDSVLEEKRRQLRERPSKPEAPAKTQADKAASKGAETAAQAPSTEAGQDATGGAGALEEEAGQQGAFNPETGEINWDCPCLGGMADGPCGEDFKTAFSCFVFSEVEPKGMDCIDKFQAMQTCFRQYPEIYGGELSDEEDESPEPAQAGQDLPKPSSEAAPADPFEEDKQQLRHEKLETPAQSSSETSAEGATPASWEDATAANKQFEKQEPEHKTLTPKEGLEAKIHEKADDLKETLVEKPKEKVEKVEAVVADKLNGAGKDEKKDA